ncbi:hypothetical protein [Actinocorallia longicatena]|uniref:Major facilitator superfamily (MFS) profile domain-containing protein n=1 Tax=Actinocorallia longicatena TaxID=111803 RepID=A0ABP6QHJ1_9ACTN
MLMFVAGVGVSMVMPAAQTSVINAVPPQQIGRASGVFSTLRQFGGVLGIAALAPLFTALGGYGSPQTFVDGFGPALGLGAGLPAAGALAALFIPARRGTDPPTPVADPDGPGERERLSTTGYR